MKASATQKHARMSPRKIRPYARMISGMPISSALTQLEYAPGKAPEIIYAVLKSAIANALNNFQMDQSTLKVERVLINQGLVMKRFMPVAKGMAHPILKRTAHVTVTVEGDVASQTGKKAVKKDEKIETLTADTFVALEEKEASAKAKELEKEESKKAKSVLAEHSEEAPADKQSSVAFQKVKMNQQGGDPKETSRRESKKTHRRKSIG